MHARSPAVAAIFEPVQAPTTFEETVERLGTAIRLGLLSPGTRLPPERELAERFDISRSTLRQALTTLVQSGHLVSQRGRTGGTFVAQAPPLQGPGVALEGQWRDLLDQRIAVECGVALLAAERGTAEHFGRMRELIGQMELVFDFPAYRRADVAFHLTMAEATGSCRLVATMTEVQGGMTDLIAHIPHPPAVLERSNVQHERLVSCLERGDGLKAVKQVRSHLEATEHILTGLMP